MRKPPQPPSIDAVVNGAGNQTRYLAAVQDPAYLAAVREVEASYRHWHRVRYLARAAGLVPEVLWALVKAARAATYRDLPLGGERGERLKFNMPDVLQEELMHIDQQLAGRLVAADAQPLSEAHQEKFIVSALREEAIASSMLEGAATTRRDAKEMLVTGRKPRTPGERMVANNYRAMDLIRERRGEPLSPEFLLEIQSVLTEGTVPPDECGRFRTRADDIRITAHDGEVLHVPPAAEELRARLAALCEFANGTARSGFVHPVVRASVLHFQIGFDHPFCDGNGRTARAVFYWSMLRAGYWLFEFLPISRFIYAGPSKYAMAYLYAETDAFDITYFLVYKAKIIARARKDLHEYIARKQREMGEARGLFESDIRLNHRQRDLIVRAMREPGRYMTIQEHLRRHHTAYATARADLLNLVEWGYLVAVKSGKRLEFRSGPGLRMTD